MATNQSFIDYICEQINEFGIVSYKKMFGEYMIYVNLKPIMTICNDIIYVKMLDEIKVYMENEETGYPYKGAKAHYILDIDNVELTAKVVSILESVIQVPKPKKKK